MSRQYLRLLFFLSVPLLIGFGIGYSVKPGASSGDKEFQSSFPSAVKANGQENRSQGDITYSRRNAITEAVAKSSPAVVGIVVTEVRVYRDPFFPFWGDDPFFKQFFGDRTYRQEVKGLGSGFIISPDGYIITNDHVAGNAVDITVTLSGGKQMKAKIVGTDPATDITLVKVEGNNLTSMTLGNSDDVLVGEWAIAMGNPFGLFAINDKPTVTVGVISATGMNLGHIGNHFYKDMMETDAAINGGNSGGPLLNSMGEVVGMNTLIYTGGQSSTYIGYGFAIPMNRVKRVVAELKQKGKVERNVWLGFEAQDVDARIARYFGLRQVEGMIISEIESGSPADKAGLKVGDIIFEINNDKVNSDEDLNALVVDTNVGDLWSMKLYRDRKTLTTQLKVGRHP